MADEVELKLLADEVEADVEVELETEGERVDAAPIKTKSENGDGDVPVPAEGTEEVAPKATAEESEAPSSASTSEASPPPKPPEESNTDATSAPTSTKSLESVASTGSHRPLMPNNNTHDEAALQTTNHVYIYSDEFAWIPARVEKTDISDKGIPQAHVVIPEYKDERSIQSDGGRTAKRFKKEVISLQDYPNQALPMQNVDDKGNLKEVEDMVDLPFLHEVSRIFLLARNKW